MKKILVIFFYLQFYLPGFSQTDLEKILSQERSIPENWVTIISSQPKWNIIDWTFIGDQTRKVYLSNSAGKSDEQATVYQFRSNNVSKFPSLIDTTNTLPAVYFPNQETFYITHTILLDNKPFIVKYPFRVYYLDSTKLALEHLDQAHFEYETGKILTKEESEKKNLDNQNKRKDQPGKYDVTDRSIKKGKSEEGLRIVELLSTVNN